MAIWQYTFHVLLKKKVEELSYLLIENRDNNDFDNSVFWDYNQLNKSFFHPINEILPQNKSWSDAIDLYGHQESNLFEVLHEKDMVESVEFRIDFRTDYEALLRQLMTFLIINGFVITDLDINIIPFDFDVIKGIINNSHQFKVHNTLMIP